MSAKPKSRAKKAAAEPKASKEKSKPGKTTQADDCSLIELQGPVLHLKGSKWQEAWLMLRYWAFFSFCIGSTLPNAS